jgi:tetratricopeptide (TPR) repeat protein
MVNKNIFKMAALPVTMLFLTLAGCAPTIQLQVEHTPNLNTAGIRRIAVMPFEAPYRDYADIAKYATTVAGSRIREMNYFTLVDPAVIARLQRNNQSIESHVDALFSGQITRIADANDTREGSYKNKDGETVYYTDYITSVELEFNYYLSMARDGRLIGPISISTIAKASSRTDYPDPSSLLRNTVDDHLRHLRRNLAPYKTVETRAFASDKTKNDALKADMKNAISLVKAGNYKPALNAYLEIYERYNSFAAAENASILYEFFGEIQTAADLLRQAFEGTGNPRAKALLARLDKILADRETLAGDYGAAGGGLKDKAAAFASAEIRKVLTEKAIVWIYNNSPDNDMAEAVVDNITADFIRKGIGVVDRNRQSANLIEAEQIYQMSGSVSDDDIVRIGNAAGANTIVFIGITGTGAMRRLQVRVLDVERRTPVMQSDSGDNWQI